MKLIDAEPFINAWKESGNSKKEEAKVLMNSGIYSEYNKGVALNAAADLVLALAEQLENAPSTAWTSVNDKQPDEDGIYLVAYDADLIIGERAYRNGKWARDNELGKIRYWMLIPGFPEVSKDD